MSAQPRFPGAQSLILMETPPRKRSNSFLIRITFGGIDHRHQDDS
jgi:hypothetical protein